jgi:alpha-tubulin suppressor-like RCC1 family protein
MMIHFYKHRFGWVVLLLCLGHIATAQLTLTTNNQTGVCHVSQTNLNSLISTNATFISWSEQPPAVDIAAGVDHNVAALSNGTVTAWGSGTSSLRAVPNLTNALQVSAARSQSFALRNDGSVVGWQGC